MEQSKKKVTEVDYIENPKRKAIKLVYNLGTTSHHDSYSEVEDEIDKQIRNIAKEVKELYDGYKSCIVVVEKVCNEKSVILNKVITIYPTLFEANDKLNSAMYSKNTVTVFAYDFQRNSFVSIMYKLSDEYRYDRLADIKEEYLYDSNYKFRIRDIYDIETTLKVVVPLNK